MRNLWDSNPQTLQAYALPLQYNRCPRNWRVIVLKHDHNSPIFRSLDFQPQKMNYHRTKGQVMPKPSLAEKPWTDIKRCYGGGGCQSLLVCHCNSDEKFELITRYLRPRKLLKIIFIEEIKSLNFFLEAWKREIKDGLVGKILWPSNHSLHFCPKTSRVFLYSFFLLLQCRHKGSPSTRLSLPLPPYLYASFG